MGRKILQKFDVLKKFFHQNFFFNILYLCVKILKTTFFKSHSFDIF